MGIFNTVVGRKPKRNKFNLSHEKKLSLKMGKLYPILLQEVIPGDSFRVNSEILLRLAPMISPVMHRVNVHTHYFFVPNRLVWNEWEDFVTGGEQGDLEPSYPVVNISETDKLLFAKGELSDYFGIPPATDQVVNNVQSISALPFRAYTMIYNEYFRDQNLTEKAEMHVAGGEVTGGEKSSILSIRQRAWEKDYFTSCLPWPQRGGEATIPMGTVEPEYKNSSAVYYTADDELGTSIENVATNAVGNLADGLNGQALRVENLEPMSVDAVAINDLRKATRLQEWLEKSARGGSRYIEQILSHFGVRSSDARLQRPEYLGGGRQPIIISEVLNTTGANDDDGGGSEINFSPQGTMAGHGISVGSNNRFKRSFEEHGYIIGLMSVLPKTAYEQGVERHWQKFDKFDLYWPEFAHLGEQEILNKELYLDYDDQSGLADQTFGYQQRYAEYKYQQSSIHGDFRDTLNFWQMGRHFDQTPSLNTNFVESDPTGRIFAVWDEEIPYDENEDTMYCQIYNNVSALRPMPYHSIPTL